MTTEFMGKQHGYYRGRGGSLHIAYVAGGNLCANGVVGGGIATAMDIALGLKMQKRERIILSFFGNGAANIGSFNASLNMATIWRLPVEYVCENNQFALSFPVNKAFAIEHIADQAAAYGMPGETVDGNDLMAVYTAVSQAAARARAGEGPSLVENVTYRWREHSKSDANRYRSREEIETWKQKCPIKRFRAQLIGEGVLTEETADRIERDAYAAVDAAVEFAETGPKPAHETIEAARQLAHGRI